MLTDARLAVLRLAVPIMLAQVAVALTGVVDTAVMGRFGTGEDLAAVGVAAAVTTLFYWAFGFLRMATTGLTAQACGADADAEVRAILQRALLLGLGLGLGLLVIVPPLAPWLVAGFDGSPIVSERAVAYLWARVTGAPAALMGFGIMGWLLGRGWTRSLLVYQVVLNGLNMVFDTLFVGVYDFGPVGIGMGTALAEWLALGLGLYLVRQGLRGGGPVFDRGPLLALFQANSDILVRTLALLAGFSWFVRAGNQEGAATAAGNQVLLQFVLVTAFVLDAFAFVAEKETGEALGSRDPGRLRQAIRITTEWSAASAILFSIGIWFAGGPLISTFIADPEARAVALSNLHYPALVPLLGFAAWELDGVMLGALRGRALRNAAVLSTVLYVGLDLALSGWGNDGVWGAFLCFYVLRALCLAPALPGLIRDSQRAEAT